MARIVNQEERTNSPLDDLISLPDEDRNSQERAKALGKNNQQQ
ncbi:hypothetical protein OZX65_02755 [Leuconostocaceae bacterium ESL0723]|nr:hypothetical protein OZX65_02755 [Leuconostocaceae bacterium ESL0723]